MRISEHRYVAAFCLLIGALCLTGIAQAQAWDTNTVGIQAPTQCSTGEPITACPVTGYRVEQSTTSTGAFATLTTISSAATTFVHNGVTEGQHCYRMFSLSALGDSPTASNVVCKTNTKPVGPPNPPVLTVADNLAMTVKKYSYGWSLVDNIGIARLGADCDETQSFGHGGYFAIKNPKANVVLYPGRRWPKVVAARCA